MLGGSIEWEDAGVPAQEAKEAETPAEKKARRQDENRQIVMDYLRQVDKRLSAFEIYEALHVLSVDIKPEQVRAAVASLCRDGALRKTSSLDPVAPPEYDPIRVTPR